jgi:hypothetical protein
LCPYLWPLCPFPCSFPCPCCVCVHGWILPCFF